ncbi:MAG: adenylate kinase [Patescibacteria group bacterium]
MVNKQFVLLGPPGSGKGTQAKILAERLGVTHISTGDIFRDHIARQTDLGVKAKKILEAGIFMPDDITNALIKEKLAQPDAKNGFILDGYPRNLVQANFLFHLMPEIKTIYISLSDEEVIKRISGRRISKSTGAIYHLQYNPPPVDIDPADIIQRSDEKEEVVKERLEIYHQAIEPLLEFYRNQHQLITIDGSPPINDVTKTIIKLINA